MDLLSKIAAATIVLIIVLVAIIVFYADKLGRLDLVNGKTENMMLSSGGTNVKNFPDLVCETNLNTSGVINSNSLIPFARKIGFTSNGFIRDAIFGVVCGSQTIAIDLAAGEAGSPQSLVVFLRPSDATNYNAPIIYTVPITYSPGDRFTMTVVDDKMSISQNGSFLGAFKTDALRSAQSYGFGTNGVPGTYSNIMTETSGIGSDRDILRFAAFGALIAYIIAFGLYVKSCSGRGFGFNKLALISLLIFVACTGYAGSATSTSVDSMFYIQWIIGPIALVAGVFLGYVIVRDWNREEVKSVEATAPTEVA